MTNADDECPEGGAHEWVWMNFQNLTPGAQECRRCPASRIVAVPVDFAAMSDDDFVAWLKANQPEGRP